MPNPFWPRIEPHLPQLWRTVRGYESDRALQEDLMQEVLMTVWQALPSLRDPKRLAPFALRIAHNIGASHVRGQLAMPRRVPLDDVADTLGDRDTCDPALADSRWLLDAVRQLPLPLRQVLLLQLEGFDYREIADMLGISVDNVGVRAHRARKRLQEINDAIR